MSVELPHLQEKRLGTPEAYNVGMFCFWNDMDCPYKQDHDVYEWTRGWQDAAQRVIDDHS
jgi:ribosome modulation factor